MLKKLFVFLFTCLWLTILGDYLYGWVLVFLSFFKTNPVITTAFLFVLGLMVLES